MAVKIGNSYVSEAAVSYAQNRIDEKSENVLGDLQKQFKDVNFGVGTQPFSGSGTNNISIAPNILRQMANDPEKRMEYEALIYDCANGLKENANRPGLKAQGVIIGSDGGLRGWSISQSGEKSFSKDEKARLAGRLPEKELTKANTDKVDAELSNSRIKRRSWNNKSLKIPLKTCRNNFHRLKTNSAKKIMTLTEKLIQIL
ncbi:MAG: hypothetical protein IJK81_07340 [Selenomonadaceae bacterium]|nr:hypothetical protein [Selenomonadaceae bacterium]